MADITRMAVSAKSEDVRQPFLNTNPAPVPQAAEPQSAVAVAAATKPAEQEDTEDAEVDKERLKDAVDSLDNVIKPLNIGLNFQQIEEIDRTYVELYDRETGEIIREIPPKQIIQLALNIKTMQGLLFDKFS